MLVCSSVLESLYSPFTSFHSDAYLHLFWGGGNGVRLSPLGTSVTISPIDEWQMSVEQFVEWLAGETEIVKPNMSKSHFVHHKSHMTWARTRTAAAESQWLTASYRKLNSMVWVRERTIPTELLPLVGEVIANFLRIEGATWSSWRIPTAVFSVF
jgi:hypothetical protein